MEFCLKQGRKISDFCLKEGKGMKGWTVILPENTLSTPERGFGSGRERVKNNPLSHWKLIILRSTFKC